MAVVGRLLETLLRVALLGKSTEITARPDRNVQARVGDTITRHFNPSAVHLFDSATTRVIRRDA